MKTRLPAIAIGVSICLLSITLSAQSITRLVRLEAAAIGTQVIVDGELGLPVGEQVTIAGFKEANGPMQNQFVVQAVNGTPVGARVVVAVDRIDDWPDKTAAVLRGCEVGELRYLHLRETNFGPNDERWKGPKQTLFLSFRPSEVVSPRQLKLRRQP